MRLVRFGGEELLGADGECLGNVHEKNVPVLMEEVVDDDETHDL